MKSQAVAVNSFAPHAARPMANNTNNKICKYFSFQIFQINMGRTHCTYGLQASMQVYKYNLHTPFQGHQETKTIAYF